MAGETGDPTRAGAVKVLGANVSPLAVRCVPGVTGAATATATAVEPHDSAGELSDARVSRVVAMVMLPASQAAIASEPALDGTRSLPAEEEIVTAVDGSRQALTEEQHAALARRIRLAMDHPGLDQTLPLGTPAPAPVRAVAPVASSPRPDVALPSVEPGPPSFKKTMLLGLPQRPADSALPPSSIPAAPMPAVRASVVREVGPPRTPPPRRSRRPGTAVAAEVAGVIDAGVEPPDHDAFQLDHRIVTPEVLAPASELVRRQAWLDVTPAPPRNAVMLPPPPGPEDGSSPGSLARSFPMPEPWQRLESARAAAARRSLAQSDARAAVALTDLPSTDPFAGFIAPAPSAARRWLMGMVVALAVVGLFSLGTFVSRWLGVGAW